MKDARIAFLEKEAELYRLTIAGQSKELKACKIKLAVKLKLRSITESLISMAVGSVIGGVMAFTVLAINMIN